MDPSGKNIIFPFFMCSSVPVFRLPFPPHSSCAHRDLSHACSILCSLLIHRTRTSHFCAFALPVLLFRLCLFKSLPPIHTPCQGDPMQKVFPPCPIPSSPNKYCCLEDLLLLSSCSHPISCWPLQPYDQLLETRGQISHSCPHLFSA